MQYYYPISADDAFLMVIDIQDRLCAAMESSEHSAVGKNTGRLMDAAAITGVPVITTEQYPKGLGSTIELLRNKDSNIRFEKLYFNAMADEKIREHTASLRRTTAILAGMEAHICVFFTAMDMLERGFHVVIASDAVCSRNQLNKQEALAQLRAAGALVLPSETIMFSLIEKAGTEEFKKISALVK